MGMRGLKWHTERISGRPEATDDGYFCPSEGLCVPFLCPTLLPLLQFYLLPFFVNHGIVRNSLYLPPELSSSLGTLSLLYQHLERKTFVVSFFPLAHRGLREAE